MSFSLAYILIALGLFVPGAIWAVANPEGQLCRITRRIFYGYALAIVATTCLPMLLGARPNLLPVFALFVIGYMAAYVGTRHHGESSWIDVSSFVAVSIVLAILGTNSDPDMFGSWIMGLPFGAMVGLFIGWLRLFRDAHTDVFSDKN